MKQKIVKTKKKQIKKLHRKKHLVESASFFLLIISFIVGGVGIWLVSSAVMTYAHDRKILDEEIKVILKQAKYQKERPEKDVLYYRNCIKWIKYQHSSMPEKDPGCDFKNSIFDNFKGRLWGDFKILSVGKPHLGRYQYFYLGVGLIVQFIILFVSIKLVASVRAIRDSRDSRIS
ncbi:MAG: hypothetical protein ISR65_17325 [Bacteriovoracaceae bacterium]|nr:hypothetical protein [Bacteriovoracaceae bacterium]